MWLARTGTNGNTRHTTGSAGTPIDGDPRTSHKQNGIGGCIVVSTARRVPEPAMFLHNIGKAGGGVPSRRRRLHRLSLPRCLTLLRRRSPRQLR